MTTTSETAAKRPIDSKTVLRIADDLKRTTLGLKGIGETLIEYEVLKHRIALEGDNITGMTLQPIVVGNLQLGLAALSEFAYERSESLEQMCWEKLET